MQLIFDGITNGVVIALVALAFVTVYLPTRIFAVELAAIFVTAPYIALHLKEMGLCFGLATLLSVALMALVGGLAESLNHRLLRAKRASAEAHLIASLGVYTIIVAIVSMVWGTEPKVLRVGLDQTYEVGHVVISGAQFANLALASLIVLVFFLWLIMSNSGLILRALADNPKQLQIFGIPPDQHFVKAFAIAGGLSGVAGVLRAYELGIRPTDGFNALLLGVIATIIGSRSSFYAPVIAGVALGMVRATATYLSSARFEDLLTFLLLALFIIVKPNGLLGTSERLEAEGS